MTVKSPTHQEIAARAYQLFLERGRQEGHDVDDFLRGNAEDFSDAGGIEDEIVLLGVEDLYVWSDQLHHVLVAGDDEDFVGMLGCLTGEGFHLTPQGMRFADAAAQLFLR